MELEFGFKKKFILAKHGDACNHCHKRQAKIYFEGNDQTTFVLCEDCTLAWVRILAQDLISAGYPDVSRKVLVDIGVADRFMQELAGGVKRGMAGQEE